jgi:hypothetical protein
MPELIFVAVLIIVIAVIVVALWGSDEKSFRESLKQLQDNGYAVKYAQERNRGTVTIIWGRYAEPIPFYVQVSNRDKISVLVGLVGIADIPVGQADFDEQFVVRSNKPAWAQLFMTQKRCADFLLLTGVQFLTTSINNVFPPAYWPAEKNRSLRDLWMLRVDGKIEPPELARYVTFAQSMAAETLAFCADKSRQPQDCVSPSLEGR